MKKFKFMLFINMVMIVFLLLSLPASAISSQPDNPVINEIQSNLQQQMTAWNRGDIYSLVKSYKNADTTLYISSTVIHGYQNILKRYLKQYPNREKMGRLSFHIIEIRVLSPTYAMAIGNWHLTRKKSGDIGGVFTLLYEKTPQGWKIVVDHSS